MAKILIVAEHADGKLNSSTAKCISCATTLPGASVDVVVLAVVADAVGDVLVTIEAMKMETAVRADRDGEIAEVVIRVSEPVDAKDLLIVMV